MNDIHDILGLLVGIAFIIGSFLMIKYPEKYYEIRRRKKIYHKDFEVIEQIKTIKGFGVFALIFSIIWTSFLITTFV